MTDITQFPIPANQVTEIDSARAKEVLVGVADSGLSQSEITASVKTTDFANYTNLFDPSDPDIQLGGFVNEEGNYFPNESYNVTGYMPVSELDVVSISATDDPTEYVGWRFVVFYDASKNYLTGISSSVNPESSMKPTKFAVPAGCEFVRATMRSDIALDKIKVMVDVKQYTTELMIDSVASNPTTKSHELFGKKILQFGDSIAHGVVNTFGMADFLAEKYSCSVADFALGGATMGSTGSNDMQEQIDSAIFSSVDCDVIIFNGGTNDISSFVPLGVMTNTFDGGYDETTYIGSFEEFCRKLLLIWPDKTIIYVRPHTMGSRDYDDQVTYGNAAIAVCEKWGIPVVDVFKNSGMNTFLPIHRDLYTNSISGTEGDRTHPNALGYKEKYIPLIENTLSLLISKRIY